MDSHLDPQTFVRWFRDFSPYINAFRGRTFVIAFGGEVIAEEFYLALDPYPRTDDADQVLEEYKEKSGQTPDQRSENPFEKLRRH